MRQTYVVAGCRPWSRRAFERTIRRYPGRWRYVSSPKDLTAAKLRALKPRYVFFLHWSWKVPSEVLALFECVCFHMTAVPYGRGGSPLQNLILRGHRSTRLTALRMAEAFDAGPVYFSAPLSLSGSAQDIYERASDLSARMVRRFLGRAPTPRAQRGRVTVFHRRKPEESRLPPLEGPRAAHDFIRMLDAEGYPRAFLDHGGLRLTFDRARLSGGKLEARVTVTKGEKP